MDTKDYWENVEAAAKRLAHSAMCASKGGGCSGAASVHRDIDVLQAAIGAPRTYTYTDRYGFERTRERTFW